MNWEEEILEYKSYLFLAKKLSTNSIIAYMADIEEFMKFTNDNYPEKLSSGITNSEVEQYFIFLNSGELSTTSQSRKISSLRSFFGFLLLYDKIKISPMDRIESPKLSRKIPDTISNEEMVRVFEVAKQDAKWIGLRNFAIIDTLYSTGIRVSELVNLRMGDLFFDDGYIRVVGKGDKERLVPINEQTINSINTYRDSIESLSTDTLFINNRKGKLTREMIFTIVKKIALKAGIARAISPHTFRHTFATDMIKAGVDIRLVQDILGHESIVTTEIYTHLDTSFKRSVLETKHPLNIKHKKIIK